MKLILSYNIGNNRLGEGISLKKLVLNTVVVNCYVGLQYCGNKTSKMAVEHNQLLVICSKYFHSYKMDSFIHQW